MKNRIIALFCTLALLLPCITVSADYTDVAKDTNEERILNIISDLGIMVGYEDGSFKPNSPITRAEFVTTIYNAVKLWDNAAVGKGTGDFNWSSFFYGGDSNDLILLPPSSSGDGEEAVVKNQLWSDVTEDYWAYPYMKTLATYGYVVGYPDGTFRPENTVTYYEAITVLLNLCGYSEHAKTRGGFPDGYNTLASHYGLSKGLYASAYGEMSRMDAATLIYNAFDMELVSLNEVDKNKTFINDIIGAYIIEGTVTATDISSLYSDEVLADNTLKIDGIEVKFDSDKADVRDYIGQHVRVYLSENDDESYTLISFEATGKDDITAVDAELFEDFTGDSFYYKTDKDSKSTKRIKLADAPVLIYNGEYTPSFDKSVFENINKGTISVIKKSDLDFDIIVVEDFKSGYTESVNAKSKEIYDMIAEEGKSVISLTSKDSSINKIVQLMDSEGNTITLDNIAKGAINYYNTERFVKLYYTEKTAKDNLTVSSDDDEKFYVAGDERYKISDRFYDYSGGSLKNNVKGTIYIDKFDEVVWMSDDVEIDGYAYIIKTRYDAENSIGLITYYDIKKAEVKERVATAETVKYYDAKGVRKDYENSVLCEELKNYDGIVHITLDDAGNIKKIKLPVDKSNAASADIKLLLETSSDSNAANYRTNYHVENYSFAHKVFMDTTTEILYIPIERTEYTSYKKVSRSHFGWNGGQGYLFKAYGFDPDSPYADIVITYQDSATTTVFDVDNMKPCFVMGVSDSVNDDGELTTVLSLYDGTTTFEVAAAEDETTGLSAFTNACSATKTDPKGSGYRISRGDIIQYDQDSVTGEVKLARIIYDADGVNPAWCGESCTGIGHNHRTSVTKGTILGTTGTYNKASDDNPIGYNNNAMTNSITQPAAGVDEIYALGFMYQMKDGLYQFTTQDLSQGFTSQSDNYWWIWTTMTKNNIGAAIYIVNEDGTVEGGTTADIKTYKQAGTDCSKCLLYYRAGAMRQIWILPD